MSFQLVEQAQAQSADSTSVNLGSELKLGGTSSRSVSDVYQKPTDLIDPLVNIIFIAGGIILVIMFMMTGFNFMKDTTKGYSEGAKILKNALIGFLVMFSAYWIVQIIKEITGTDIIL